MSPTIVLDGDDVRMVIGTPGGSTIFTSVFQGIINVIDNRMPAFESVAASRFHHQLLPPDLITTSISIPLPEETKSALQEKGYRVEPHAWEFGDLQLIETSNGETNTASDPRGIGVSGVLK
jgi:gamma-glutamyltranspeptidase/glutathione hydrolase